MAGPGLELVGLALTYPISELRDGLGTFREHLERHVPLEVWAPVGALLP